MKKNLNHPDHHNPSVNKCSFILRIWLSDSTKENGWRASLEIPESGKRIGFASMEQLFAYLLNFTEISCDLQSNKNKGKGNQIIK
jgi:hypothetical protein